MKRVIPIEDEIATLYDEFSRQDGSKSTSIIQT